MKKIAAIRTGIMTPKTTALVILKKVDENQAILHKVILLPINLRVSLENNHKH